VAFPIQKKQYEALETSCTTLKIMEMNMGHKNKKNIFKKMCINGDYGSYLLTGHEKDE